MLGYPLIRQSELALDISSTELYHKDMNCLFCAKKLEGKKQYCDDAHRMAYRRRTKQGEQPEQNDPEHTTRTLDFEATRTDSLFESNKPNYYNYDTEVFERKCILPDCNRAFKTHLKLLKFCSPDHQLAGIDRIVRTGKVEVEK